MLNGLNDKFDYILNVVKHQKPFPSFDGAKNMLEMEESHLKKIHKVTATHKDHSSSSTVLVATDQPNLAPQQYNNRRNNSGRGNRRGNRNKGRYNNNNYHQRPNYNNWGSPPPWYGFNNWSQQPQQSPAPWKMPPHIQYAPRPYTLPAQCPAPAQAHLTDANLVPTTDFAEAFNTMTLADPSQHGWFMDSGATAHLASSSSILHFFFNTNTGRSVMVGNGSSIPISSSGNSIIPSQTRPLHLKDVMIAPNIIRNLVSVCRFTTDNRCSVEFDPFGFSVKDLETRKLLLRSDSTGDLYPVPSHLNKSMALAAITKESPSTWHKRLVHTNNNALNLLISSETDNPSKVFQDILLAPQPTESVSVPPKPTPATTNNAPSQPPIPVQRMTMGSQMESTGDTKLAWSPMAKLNRLE
ncbi:PREDICTED: uncharacterized protein LOC106338222 [Brassica oleracea var. oleracea]|uniref:uncharacterized protein LOC106338222 n=1 Tax=Brassica oleracea var. oleracea TaxID=109376 RepID=UPI0006A6F871|nr:PREDICTED: uncharacterized protein LOC106338222 [Brassica oleracea var. oleracea]